MQSHTGFTDGGLVSDLHLTECVCSPALWSFCITLSSQIDGTRQLNLILLEA